MKNSLVELVNVIVRRIQAHPDAPPSEKVLRSWLTRQGYAKRDIDAAIKLVRPRFSKVLEKGSRRENGTDTGFHFAGLHESLCQPPRCNSVRVLSVHEEYKLTPEAHNALTRLELSGMIDPYEREMIMDYLDHFEGEVGLEEMDYLLSWMVCSGRDVESQQAFFNILEGKGETRH